MWTVVFSTEFDSEFEALPTEVQDEFFAQANWIEEFGPKAGRPRVDTLKGSRYANMKELIFAADDGVSRVAFAFDPRRMAIVLVAGDKSGVSQKKFYQRLIDKADEWYGLHLDRLERAAQEQKRGRP